MKLESCKLSFMKKKYFNFAIGLVAQSCLLLPSKAISQTLTANPNPFTNITVLSYTIDVTDSYTLSVYNSLGAQLVVVYSGSILPQGYYTANIDLSAYPDGKYNVLLIRSSKSVAASLVKSATVGLPGTQEYEDRYLYPNPTDGHLTVWSDCPPTVIKADGSQWTAVSTEWLPGQYEISLPDEGVYVISRCDGAVYKHRIVIRK